MKRIQKILLVIAIVTLASCGSNNNNNPQANDQLIQDVDSVTPAPTVTIALTEYRNCENCPNITSVEIQGDKLTITQDGTPYLYEIDNAESFEEISYNKYFWTFRIARVDEQSPDYGEVSIPKFMDDIYGEPGEYDIYPCYISTTDCYKARLNDDYSLDSGFLTFTIASDIALERGFLERHPESKPLPELSFDINKFSTFYGIDIATVPGFVKDAKRVTIKDRFVVFDCEDKAVALEIMPLSDREIVYSEGYNWCFLTKADGAIPSMCLCVNTGFYEDIPNPDDRWISLDIDGVGYYSVKFNSWSNLQRKIMASYPTDEEYYTTKEEGILPDYSDEEEEYYEE